MGWEARVAKVAEGLGLKSHKPEPQVDKPKVGSDQFWDLVYQDSPEEAVRGVIDLIKQGQLPPSIPEEDKKRMYRQAQVFERFLDERVIRVVPISWGSDKEMYDDDNIRHVPGPDGHLEVDIHPLMNNYVHFMEDFNNQRTNSRYHIARTIHIATKLVTWFYGEEHRRSLQSPVTPV